MKQPFGLLAAAALLCAAGAPAAAQTDEGGAGSASGGGNAGGHARAAAAAPLPAVNPTPNAQRGPSGIPDDAAYRLNPGDDIEIYVWGDERLQRELKVLPDGSIAFPLVGTIRAAGRTSTQLENDIAQHLAGQYKAGPPQVTVSVKQPTGLTVSVIGKVRSPGSFSPGRYITLLDALATAGGPTDFADVNNIVILRKVGNHLVAVNGQLTGVLKGKPTARDLSGNGIPVLQPGDTVIVP